MLGLFGSLFDLNNDGELSPEEMALELFLFDEIVNEPLRINSEDSEKNFCEARKRNREK